MQAGENVNQLRHTHGTLQMKTRDSPSCEVGLNTGNWVASQRFTPSGYVSAAFPGRTSSTMTRPGPAARGSSSPHGLGGMTHASTLPRDPMRASAIMEHQKGEDGSSSGVASAVNVLCLNRVCHATSGHVAVYHNCHHWNHLCSFMISETPTVVHAMCKAAS